MGLSRASAEELDRTPDDAREEGTVRRPTLGPPLVGETVHNPWPGSQGILAFNRRDNVVDELVFAEDGINIRRGARLDLT